MTGARTDQLHDVGLEGNLAEWFDRQAQLTPDAVAIIDDREWTYGELRNRVHALAAGLATHDLEPETTIGVVVSRNAEMVALLLAILWSGCSYVPVDPEDPTERAVQLLNAASCALVVADDEHNSRLLSGGAASRLPPLVRSGAIAASGGCRKSPACALGDDRLAYVLFTSGSTGAPKGVEVEHRQVLHIVQAARQLLEFGPGDRYLAVATIAFDISVIELFLPLLTGGSLLLRSRAALSDPAQLFADLREHDVTAVQLGPSSWSVLLESGLDLPPLKVAITTGEAIAPELARRLGWVADNVWNLYGPTETTVWVTGHRLGGPSSPADVPVSAISAPIGAPLPSCTALVVDDTGMPQPDNAIGELLIGGACLARGYRDNPVLTGEKFITFAGDGQRYYRTGDLVSRSLDGVLHYYGRVDDQLKIRGVRIEPREVEAALLALPEVANAAATWFDAQANSRGLCCAIVWAPGRDLPFDDVQKRLRASLPAAMVPSRFVALDDLPLTANGKVDRKTIREATGAQYAGEQSARYNPLELTDTEGRLLSIWAKALGTRKVTLDTNFFAEGGDSLSAIAMLLDVERAMGAKLDPEAIARAPRLRDFATSVEKLRLQPVELTTRKTVFPLVEDGDGPPLFFSNIDRKIGRSVDWKGGCAVYALVQWAYGRGFVRADSIQELAAAQIREIRLVQPTGPYRIGGYSLGGLIALEIARQLRVQGDEVDMLLLLDPMAPVQYRTVHSGAPVRADPFRRPPLRERLERHLRSMASDPLGALPNTARKAMAELRRLGIWQRLAYHRLDLYGRFPSRFTRLLVPSNRWPAFWWTASKFARRYAAEPYDGNCLAVFHDRDPRFDIWRSILSTEAELAVISTTHLGFFEEPALGTWMEMVSAAVSRTGPETSRRSRMSY